MNDDEFEKELDNKLLELSDKIAKKLAEKMKAGEDTSAIEAQILSMPPNARNYIKQAMLRYMVNSGEFNDYLN